MIEILTIILILVTSLYVYYTYKILKTNESVVSSMLEQNITFLRPYIIIEIVITLDAYFYLKIINIGKTSAENLKLSIDKDFYTLGNNSSEKNIRNRYEFKNTIKSFPPNNILNVQLAHGSQLFSVKNNLNITPLNFNINAEYNFRGQKFNEDLNIDLNQYSDMVLLRDPISNELNIINKGLIEISKNLKNIRTTS